MNRAQDARNRALAALEAWAPTPSNGLPEELFRFFTRFVPIINVDLLIQDDRHQTLLTWRHDQFYGPGWHVPGGIIRYKETPEARIRATARLELAAEVDFAPQPITVEQWIEPERRDRGHFISLLYRCRLLTGPAPNLRFHGGPPTNGQWAWHECCPPNLIPEQAAFRRYFV
jgi:ADP-ribose pyrophosphatase YjhB (NUDIX family)